MSSMSIDIIVKILFRRIQSSSAFFVCVGEELLRGKSTRPRFPIREQWQKVIKKIKDPQAWWRQRFFGPVRFADLLAPLAKMR